jgi:hypothetical protein
MTGVATNADAEATHPAMTALRSMIEALIALAPPFHILSAGNGNYVLEIFPSQGSFWERNDRSDGPLNEMFGAILKIPFLVHLLESFFFSLYNLLIGLDRRIN